MIRRLMDSIGRRRVPLILLALVVTIVPVGVATYGSGGSRVTTTVLLLVAASVVFVFAVALSGRDPDAEARAQDVAPDPVSAALFARWLRRSKHFRFVGGLSGAVLGFAVADGSFTPVLVGLLAGIAVGGAAAELHSFGGRRPSSRSADITIRHLRDYVTRTDTVALILIGGAGVGLIGVGVVRGSDERALLWTASAALVAVVAAAGMQWAVVVRRRPAMSAGLRRADDLMRRLAATQGFTRPTIAFALVMVSQGLTTFGRSTVVTIAVVVLWTLALAWYVSSRQSRTNLRALVGP